MNYNIRILAGQYAYDMCGSSPCEDCNEFCHMTTEEERTGFIKCVNEARCDAAKEYNAQYDKYIKEYLEKHGDNKG